MMTSEENLEIPFLSELARAVINRAAMDYIMSLMLLNGKEIPKTPLNYDVRAKPDSMREECETFFFSGWFRFLSADSGLDGMMLASMIENDWESMYQNMQKAKSGRPAAGTRMLSADRKERERIKARMKYRQKKLKKEMEKKNGLIQNNNKRP